MLTAAEQYRILVAKLESINPSTIVEEEDDDDDDDAEDTAPVAAGAGSAVVTPQVAVQPSAMTQVVPAAAPRPAGWLSTVPADPNSVTNPTPEQLAAWANGQNPPTTWNKNRTTGKYEPPVAAAAPVAAGDGSAVVTPQVAVQPSAMTQVAPPPAPGAYLPTGPAAAGPINRDSMSFNQAFADARAKGEKQFPWKGKQYAVQMAPAAPVGRPAGDGSAKVTPQVAPAPSAMNQYGTTFQPRATAPAAAAKPAAAAAAPVAAPAPAPAPKKETYRGLDGKIYYKAESVTYSEDQSLARIVQLARGR